jgi:hypothetical protein
MKPQISSRDLNSLSLFLDGQLSPAERQRLERRLEGNHALRQALIEMQQTRTLLRSMPKRRAPHNFTLSPQMVGVRERRSVFPVMGFVSALASILFVLVLAGDLTGIFTSSTRSVALQAMPMVEAAAPTLEAAQEKRAQPESSDSPTPAETQAQEAQALKAIAPPSDETGAEPSDTLPPALMGAGQEASATATPEVGFEHESQPMVSPTGVEGPIQAQAKQAGTDLTPPALSQNAAPATEVVGAVELSEPSSEQADVSQGEAGEQGQNAGVSAKESSLGGQTPQFILRIFEVIFAVTALITAVLFFSQRRKTIQ